MGTVDKISISLPGETTEHLRQAVASGEYGSTSEVIRDAIREWRERRERLALETETLRHLWRAGLASAEGRLGGIEAIKRAARARKRAS